VAAVTVAKPDAGGSAGTLPVNMLPHQLSRLVALFVSLPLFAACGYGDNGHHGIYGNGANCSGAYCNGATNNGQGTIEQANIDTDRMLVPKPGAGADVLIEYASGGTYRFSTTCDSNRGNSCYWDILVTPLDGAAVLSVAPVALESDDSVSLGSGNQVRFVAYTAADVDGFTLQTDPGAAVEVDALLDNGAANDLLFWFGDGALNQGAPSNPIDLQPSAD